MVCGLINIKYAYTYIDRTCMYIHCTYISTQTYAVQWSRNERKRFLLIITCSTMFNHFIHSSILFNNDYIVRSFYSVFFFLILPFQPNNTLAQEWKVVEVSFIIKNFKNLNFLSFRIISRRTYDEIVKIKILA